MNIVKMQKIRNQTKTTINHTQIPVRTFPTSPCHQCNSKSQKTISKDNENLD